MLINSRLLFLLYLPFIAIRSDKRSEAITIVNLSSYCTLIEIDHISLPADSKNEIHAHQP